MSCAATGIVGFRPNVTDARSVAGRAVDRSDAKGKLGRQACVGVDRVADRDLVVFADQDFADDEPQDALPLVEAELVETVGEAADESSRVSASLT